MLNECSLSEAATHLSALVQQVRDSGQVLLITVDGEPVAELRPHRASPPRAQTLGERIAELDAGGYLTRSSREPGEKPHFPLGAPNPGALQRFLDERD